MCAATGLLRTHDAASSVVGYFTSARVYVQNLWKRRFPKSSKNKSDVELQEQSEEISASSSSSWSDQDNDVKR